MFPPKVSAPAVLIDVGAARVMLLFIVCGTALVLLLTIGPFSVKAFPPIVNGPLPTLNVKPLMVRFDRSIVETGRIVPVNVIAAGNVGTILLSQLSPLLQRLSSRSPPSQVLAAS